MCALPICKGLFKVQIEELSGLLSTLTVTIYTPAPTFLGLNDLPSSRWGPGREMRGREAHPPTPYPDFRGAGTTARGPSPRPAASGARGSGGRAVAPRGDARARQPRLPRRLRWLRAFFVNEALL